MLSAGNRRRKGFVREGGVVVCVCICPAFWYRWGGPELFWVCGDLRDNTIVYYVDTVEELFVCCGNEGSYFTCLGG